MLQYTTRLVNEIASTENNNLRKKTSFLPKRLSHSSSSILKMKKLYSANEVRQLLRVGHLYIVMSYTNTHEVATYSQLARH